MSYSRPNELETPPSPNELSALMKGIGLNFAGAPVRDGDIELTLIHASNAGMVEGDLRVLSVLTTWLGVHHRYVNVDRLLRAVKAHQSPRVVAYWSAIARWLAADRRFARLERLRKRSRTNLLSVGTKFQLARRGEDERFAGSALRVPAGVLRDRKEDVLSPNKLAELHRGYRNRVQMGPSWRADVWTVLQSGPELSVAETARRARCSFAVAWEVRRDFSALNAADFPDS
ncbi:MAG: hypothetical protein ACI835_005542 [Planctomycetota bacterium]|jgi:hypothetical protein